VTALFVVTVFLSATLTFLIQPMMGKQLLPLVGGTPGVWNTCLVFFQATLLLGYWLAHLARNRLYLVLLVLVFAGLMLIASTMTPLAIRFETNFEQPVFTVLKLLALTVGAPFLALSMTAPLLQSWFARTARNPYPLYAASNLGSFVGLLSYPLVIEPWIANDKQYWYWVIAFGVWFLSLTLCAAVTVRPGHQTPSEPTTPLPPRRILKWVGLAALTSSFLMSVTTHLTTDIAPVPLLWVIPLALYLLSFVIVFSRWPKSARLLLGRITPMFLCFLAVAVLTRANEPMILVACVHLLAFMAVAVLCHGELAADRPDASQLTQFYLWLSVGGVVGGLLNTFVAPWLFSSLGNVEYPLAMVLAGLVRPPSEAVGVVRKRADGIWPLALGAFTGILVFGIPMIAGMPKTDNPADELLDRVIRGGSCGGRFASRCASLRSC
jgi:hypothetical protein